MDIGIFWVYKNKVLGKRCPLINGVQSVGGLVDTDFSHYQEWELNKTILKPFNELKGSEYQQFPRGRVLYSKPEKTFFIYIDPQLNNLQAKTLIREFFSLQMQKVRWRLDSHYTTFDSCL